MRTLVVGGTGTVGTEVVARLSARGDQVRVGTRTTGRPLPEGVQGVEVDLQRPQTLAPALEGCARMVLITPLAPDEAEQGCRAVEAAARAGIEHVVFMSVQDADAAPHVPHFASKVVIRRALEEARLPHTIVLPNNFMQNDLWYRDVLLGYGIYPQPIGGFGVSRVDVRDIADAIVACLGDPRHVGKSYTLAGPEALTGEQVAAEWSRALGREIRYGGDDLQAWAEQARQMLPPWLVDDLVVMYGWFADRGLVASAEDLRIQEQLLGRPARGFDAFVDEIAAVWRASA